VSGEKTFSETAAVLLSTFPVYRKHANNSKHRKETSEHCGEREEEDEEERRRT
jgi:hypothetical protein